MCWTACRVAYIVQSVYRALAQLAELHSHHFILAATWCTNSDLCCGSLSLPLLSLCAACHRQSGSVLSRSISSCRWIGGRACFSKGRLLSAALALVQHGSAASNCCSTSGMFFIVGMFDCLLTSALLCCSYGTVKASPSRPWHPSLWQRTSPSPLTAAGQVGA